MRSRDPKGQGRDPNTFVETVRNGWIATKLAHDGPHMSLHPRYAQDQGQGQMSRDTATYVI